jgi:DNA-binding HxlR family transcriptional regulator
MAQDRVKLEGVLADRDAWVADDCSLAKALEVVGTRSGMLVMREAFYGAHRFDEFTRRLGIGDAVASTRLQQLTAAGLLRREPYRDPGQRERHDYHLTDKGIALLPALLALMRWGDQYLTPAAAGPVALSHAGCGEPVEVAVRCAAGHAVPVSELSVRVNRRRRSGSR